MNAVTNASIPSGGGRYGIWGVNPYGPTFEKQSVLDRALNVAEGIGKWNTNRYDTMLKSQQAKEAALKNQETEATIENKIAAENVKNVTDTKYYPMLQAMELASKGATLSEIKSRTGLNNAEAGKAYAQGRLANRQTQMLNPSDQFNQLNEQFKRTPAGPLKDYLRLEIGKMMGNPGMVLGGKPGKGSSSSSSSSGSGIGSNEVSNGLDINAMKPKMGGVVQGYDPATGEVIEGPTTASATRDQRRLEGEVENKYLNDYIVPGQNAYTGAWPSGQVLADSVKARLSPKSAGGKAAANRLRQSYLASKLVPEAASINAKNATGDNPGIEMVREFTEKGYSGMPKGYSYNFLPPSIQNDVNNIYPQIQRKLTDVAVQPEREGYKTQSADQPRWAQQQAGQQGGYYDQNNQWVPLSQGQPQQPQGGVDYNELAREFNISPEQAKQMLSASLT